LLCFSLSVSLFLSLSLSWQVLYYLSHASSPFYSSYFSNRLSNFYPRQFGLRTSCLCFQHSRDKVRAPPNSAFIGWDRILLPFSWGWPPTLTLPISASWVAGITSTQPYFSLLRLYFFSIFCVLRGVLMLMQRSTE
jgi:hypothetical protein